MSIDRAYDHAAITWVNEILPDARVKPQTDRPWAQTWRVIDRHALHFLKQVSNGTIVDLTAMLADIAPDRVPAVLERESSQGLMLLADHGGTQLTYDDRAQVKATVLDTYASLQVEINNAGIPMDELPMLDCKDTVHSFYDFLAPGPSHGKRTGLNLEYFFGGDQAAACKQVFDAVRKPLSDYLALAERLPLTLNHCDLRPSNMALKRDGSVIIYDWDDATIGPLGLSLHAQFSGVTRPYFAMTGSRSQLAGKDRRDLNAYARPWLESRLCAPETMRDCLGSSIALGILHHLLTFRHFAELPDEFRRSVQRNLRRRFDDILRLCEDLVSGDEAKSKQLAEAYFQTGLLSRLERFQARENANWISTDSIKERATRLAA